MDAEFDISTLLYSNYTIPHFLPLWLEWLVENVDDDKNLPHLWPRDFSYLLNHSGWLNWPFAEVEAIRRVIEAWTHETLVTPGGKMFPEFLLEVEDRIDRYFDLWLESRPLEVACWLMKQDWMHALPVLLQWVVKPHVEENLEGAFRANSEGEHAELFSRVAQLLRSIRALRPSGSGSA
jgi:hypothetical protein